MQKIKIAVVGVGNCASALIQGVQYYTENDTTMGLTYETIGGYKVKDIEFVVGFDVDKRKVGKLLSDAIYEKPNCTFKSVDNVKTVCGNAKVLAGPRYDGVADHMFNYPKDVTFDPIDDDNECVNADEYRKILKDLKVDVVLNYLPVGSIKASKFYIENAIKAGCAVVNCMPSYISTEESMKLEQLAIDNDTVIVGHDMRSDFGASRLSEVLQGSMLDAGQIITQHIQENKASGCTQGTEHIISGRTANTDFLNMANHARLKDKHISKENVLKGQNTVRDKSIAGHTLYAGPSLTVLQKPGGTYMGSDNKVATIDIISYGFAGARYELTARLSVQDSYNSGGIVVDAVRFCKVAKEMNIVGILRGASAYTQKTPPLQMKTADSKFECDMLAKREITELTRNQLKSKSPKAKDLPYTFQKNETDYE